MEEGTGGEEKDELCPCFSDTIFMSEAGTMGVSYGGSFLMSLIDDRT